MKVRMICFSRKGEETGLKLLHAFRAEGLDAELSTKSREIPESVETDVKTWTGSRFTDSDVLIFIGACGIAVRSIAPFVRNKKTDPAVLCADEYGHFVISLLSGHLGGANAFTRKTAEILGAVPVITTATDLGGKFAVDSFARENQCAVFPMDAAKRFSSALLSDRTVGFFSEFPLDGTCPDGVILYGEGLVDPENGILKEEQKNLPDCGAALTIHDGCRPFKDTVMVVPKCVSIGIGCRKGQSFEAVRGFVFSCMESSGILPEAVSCIASIDLKKDEEALILLAKELNVPFRTFSSEELSKVEGSFEESAFVRSITGVGNVCETSAVLASCSGRLLMQKKKGDGVTCAFACSRWRGSF